MTKFGYTLMSEQSGPRELVNEIIRALHTGDLVDHRGDGDDGQDRFLAEAAGPLLDKLRAAAPRDAG